MVEQKDKTTEKISDEDYKVAPTSADKGYMKKVVATEVERKAETTGENYLLPSKAKMGES
jgi:hypothetical protein